MDETISVRIPKDKLNEINKILKYKKMSKSVILREIVEKGIKEKMLEIALEKFQNKEASASKAAKIAEIPLTVFLDILHSRGINFHYGLEDFKEDIEDLK